MVMSPQPSARAARERMLMNPGAADHVAFDARSAADAGSG
jgi:hypothetical protein